MSGVNTVLGPVDAKELGRTLIHEHILVALPGAEMEPVVFDRASFVADAVERLRALRERCGVRTLVDPCPMELGRDPLLLAEVSERSGVHIICATGFYMEVMGIPLYWRMRSAEEIAELYISEIAHGIGTTGIRPGIIKVATGAPAISELEYRCLTAACIAQQATGVPILTHTEDGQCGPDQQEAFRRGGVASHRCVIGHSCGNPDINYHRQIVGNGSYIGFDRIGYVGMMPDEVRADNVVRLIDDGSAGHILLSQDMICGYRGKNVPPPLAPVEVAQKEALSREGLWPLRQTYLFDKFLPMLRERGVGDALINALLDENPRRFFSGEPIAELRDAARAKAGIQNLSN